MHIRLAYITMEMLEHNRIACTANHSQVTLDLGFGDNSSARSRRLKLAGDKGLYRVWYETDQKMLPARPRRLPLLDKQGMQSRRHGKQNDGQKSAIRLGSARRQ